MRIISGTFKGRRITAPKKLPVRPTTDMAKEGLFNILNNHFYFDEIIVLDLFAGTGNICKGKLYLWFAVLRPYGGNSEPGYDSQLKFHFL